MSLPILAESDQAAFDADMEYMRGLVDRIEAESRRTAAPALPILGRTASRQLNEAIMAAQFLLYNDDAWVGAGCAAELAGMAVSGERYTAVTAVSV